MLTSDQRRIKQIIIATIYVLCHISIFGSLVFVLWPEPPEEPDQGPVYQDLEVEEFTLLELGNDRVDLVAEIHNPNPNVGLEEFQYQFLLEKDDEQEIITGTSYITPGVPRRYVAEINYLYSGYDLIDVTVTQTSPWEQLGRIADPSLVVRNTNLFVDDRPGNTRTLSATITNRSLYNIRNVDLIGVIRNQEDEITAINTNRVRDITENEARDFEMIWNTPIPEEDIDRKDIFWSVNILDQEERY